MAAVTRDYLGPSGVVVGALLVGLVILDTTLVSISRTRAGRSVLSGGRDHLTHRLAVRLGGPRNVALVLALAQLVVCGITITVAQAGAGWVLLAGGAGLLLGLGLIWQFEKPVVAEGDEPGVLMSSSLPRAQADSSSPPLGAPPPVAVGRSYGPAGADRSTAAVAESSHLR
jgi:hypothetical protein